MCGKEFEGRRALCHHVKRVHRKREIEETNVRGENERDEVERLCEEMGEWPELEIGNSMEKVTEDESERVNRKRRRGRKC